MSNCSIVTKWVWIILLIALVVFACGCAPQPVSLAWGKIVDGPGFDFTYMHRTSGSRMVVLVDRQGITTVQGNLPPSHLQLIASTDWSTYCVVVIYQGMKTQTEYFIEVTDVHQEGNTIKIYAQFNEPSPGTPAGQLVTSPYYILKVKKTEAMKGEMGFILIANGKEEDRQSHNIP